MPFQQDALTGLRRRCCRRCVKPGDLSSTSPGKVCPLTRSYCPSEAEAGGLVDVGVSGQPGLHSTFQASKDYIVKPTFKGLNYGLWTFFGAESWRLAWGMNRVLTQPLRREDFNGLTQLTNKNPLKGKDDELSVPMDCHWRESNAERFYVSSLKERKNPNQD